MTKQTEKNFAGEAKKAAELEATSFQTKETAASDEAKAGAKARKAEDNERSQLVSEGKRVFVEEATDVKAFEPVYANHVVAEEVNVRAAQSKE